MHQEDADKRSRRGAWIRDGEDLRFYPDGYALLFEQLSPPPALQCTASFWADSGCTSENDPTKLYRPRPLVLDLSRPLMSDIV
jgi:hypothetical protein